MSTGNALAPAHADSLALLAARALELVRPHSVVGLGTGRAAEAFLGALASRLRQGLSIRGVPTSEATARRCRQLGIPLAELDATSLDVTIDGADEVDPHLNLIKGYGGALARERIVAAASRRQIILVEADKLVPVLGSRGRLPVEIVPFALPLARHRLEALGYRPELRRDAGRRFVTDNGNFILDLAVHPIENPVGLDRQIRAIPGVADTGLFLGTADTVLVAEGRTLRELRRGSRD